MSMDRGRPRSFDEEAVLDAALKVFWKHGFQSTSLSELSKATNLNKPSLYGAFGDKKSLYLKALQRYLNMLMDSHRKELNAGKNSKEAVEAYLMSVVRMLTNPTLPGGCFIINGTADFGGTIMPKEVEDALKEALRGSEAILGEYFKHAHKHGDLPEGATPNGLAKLFFTLIAGLSVQAKSGAEEDTLREIVQTAMAAWHWPGRHSS